MSAVTLQLPDDLDLALNMSADEVAHTVLEAAAVKLFERGKISASPEGRVAEGLILVRKKAMAMNKYNNNYDGRFLARKGHRHLETRLGNHAALTD